jgi:hypothetical protein
MQTEYIKSEFYTLTQDVENPTPDRRKRYDISAFPIYQKGLEVECVIHLLTYEVDGFNGVTGGEDIELVQVETKSWKVSGHSFSDEQVTALKPYLEREESNVAFLRDLGVDDDYIKARLFEMALTSDKTAGYNRLLTREQVAWLYDCFMAAECDEESARSDTGMVSDDSRSAVNAGEEVA